MAARGLRSVLQPVLFVGIASLLHGLLFLIPGSGPATKDPGTTRGIRVKAYVERPPSDRSPVPPPASRPDMAAVPPVTADRVTSAPGRDVPGAGKAGGGRPGDEGGPHGAPGPSQGPVVGDGGPPARSEYGQYLAHLRSDGVQGWARDSAKASRQGWKGSGSGGSGTGWGTGRGAGSGSGTGGGGSYGSGTGGTGGTYMDPRVQMVVTRYAYGENGSPDYSKGKNIEHRFRQVSYPDLKVKKARYTSGWWNVYIELWTNKAGEVDKYNILRPETDGPLERVFVEQVKKEMAGWTFDPGVAEVHLDVRFYVE